VPATVTLRPEPASVRDARRFVCDRLSAIGFADAVFVGELLVSELVTNAVLHARTDIRVEVDQRGDVVRIGVSDRSLRGVRPRAHSIESGTGRGLLLVDRMAQRWGVDLHDDGKVVWFELPREPALDAGDDLLDAWEA
jgi:anti-sigma regulatory factor (Ser/Thr protein kinase)